MPSTLVTPTLFRSEPATNGGVLWTNPELASSAGTNGTSITLDSGEQSDWLLCTKFDNFFDATCRFTGTEILFQDTSPDNGLIYVHSVRLIKNDIIQPLEGVLLPIFADSSFASRIVGTSSSLLTDSLAPVEANDAGCGIAFRVYNSGTETATLLLRAVRAIFTYDIVRKALPARRSR